MTDKDPSVVDQRGGTNASAIRRERLAAALRENLTRRKAQSRARQEFATIEASDLSPKGD